MNQMRFPTAAIAAVLLSACGGGGGGDPAPAAAPAAAASGQGAAAPAPTPAPTPAPPSPPATITATKAEAAAFLTLAGVDARAGEVDALTGADATQWVSQELAKPAFGYQALLQSRIPNDKRNKSNSSQALWESLLTSDAELRARMTYALSQIIVVGNAQFGSREAYGLGTWLDVLDRNAFGNYRDLLQEVTYSPIMGDYLTFAYNRKGDPSRGRQPDENYAREILQLFSIGLVELNMDGMPRLDSQGREIETYGNDDVIGLARVFTGLAHAGTEFRPGRRTSDSYLTPMTVYEDQHSTLEKQFLGTTIPAGTPGEQSISQALDAIFAHANVAPFVSRQLIQRFTASHPSPAYVERVARAFETGSFSAPDGTTFGAGVRGDLSATLAAILLDPTVHDGVTDATEGKLREPVLKYAQLARTYTAPNGLAVVSADWNPFRDTSSSSGGLSQSPLKSPSVFNFYRPGYIAPSTETGDAGLTAPELQIVNQAAAIGYLNFMTGYLTQGETDRPGRPRPDLSEELAVAEDAEALVNLIDLKLTRGAMRSETRTAIVGAVEALGIREKQRETDLRSRVRIALLMTVGSADYAVAG